MAREQGLIVTFSRGYGFVTTSKDIQDKEAPRYFFHASQVNGNVSALRPGLPVTFEITASDRAEGKSLAVAICDANNGPIVFSRAPEVNTNVSAPGRRVAVAERSTRDDATFCFAIDQETGERVFVPLPLFRGQQIEYTLEQTDKGPKATNITAPMGGQLNRPSAGGRGRGGFTGGRGFGGGRGGYTNQQPSGFHGGRGGYNSRFNNFHGQQHQQFHQPQQQLQQHQPQSNNLGGYPQHQQYGGVVGAL